jgi:putative ABC transport system permease protein
MRFPFSRKRRQVELSEEIQSHLEMAVRDRIERGEEPVQARAAAQREFGNAAVVREVTHDQWGWAWLENLFQDLRFGVRMLRKSPGFTTVAVLTLALGIGANTAIFSIVDAVLIRPLPYAHADRLVQLAGELTSIPIFNVLRERTPVFEAVSAYNFTGIDLTGMELPEELKGMHASAGYFDVFSVPMARGRWYTAEEDRPEGPNVVVISNALWVSHFRRDPHILGRTIELGREPYRIIGVTALQFTDPSVDVWLPLRADPNSTNQANYLRCVGLLNRGVTVARARAFAKLATAEFKREFPQVPTEPTLTAVPLKESLIRGARSGLLLLFGTVAFVLLIACANVANLLLARGTLRNREFSIRAILGAGRGRLFAQLFTENLLLSLIGGTLGLAVGYSAVKMVLASTAANIPRIGDQGSAITLDWRLLVFAALIAVVTGVLFGAIPALSASRTDDLNSAVKDGRYSRRGLLRDRARSILVVAEIALALILMTGATLLIRTMASLDAVDPGFDAHNVLLLGMALTGARFSKAAAVQELEREGRERIRAVPGVEAAAMTCCPPLDVPLSMPFTTIGLTTSAAGSAEWAMITPGYFKVFRVPLIAGRVFSDRDTDSAIHVAIISQGMAKEYWPKGDALGSEITIGKGLGPNFSETPRQIVGIVGDVRTTKLTMPPEGVMYVPVSQVSDGVLALVDRILPAIWVVRTRTPVVSLEDKIRRELTAASGGTPIGQFGSMDQLVGASIARSQFDTTVLSIFGALALVLAGIGIYGLFTFSVRQRTHEIGIRVALGAQPNGILRNVLGEGARLALVGIVLGVAAALGLTRLLASMLFGVSATDPLTFAAAVAVLLAIALLACYIPARRAMRVDPMVALRHE